jgi:hypothetical protein
MFIHNQLASRLPAGPQAPAAWGSQAGRQVGGLPECEKIHFYTVGIVKVCMLLGACGINDGWRRWR